jgi:hypothetical protein
MLFVALSRRVHRTKQLRFEIVKITQSINHTVNKKLLG